jgi:hypothetical protein
MVDRLLALKGRLEAVLGASFGSASAFGGTLRDALSYALNTRWVVRVGGGGVPDCQARLSGRTVRGWVGRRARPSRPRTPRVRPCPLARRSDPLPLTPLAPPPPTHLAPQQGQAR